MASTWRAELFGCLRATGPGGVISRFQSQQTACLFAYLAVHRNRSQPKELLVDLIWPDTDPALARRRLNQALYSLRRQFETPGLPGSKIFISDWHSIQIDGESLVTDVGEFEEAIGGVRTREADTVKLERLNRASELYKGELVPDLYGEWLEPYRQRYAEMYRKAMEMRCLLLEQAGNLDAAVLVAEELLEAEPLEEESYFTLIRLHGLRGQASAALRLYRRLETVLKTELGETPSVASRNLIESIRSSNSRLDSASENTPKPTLGHGERPHSTPRIPHSMTRFFGREEEQATVTQLISDSRVRLLTLVGAGGCGKTRLAVETARALDETYRGNVWFVSLAELSNATQIPEAILLALEQECRGTTPLLSQVIAFLKPHDPALLVLDNFEHILEAGTSVIQDLLQRLPTLQVLITSRQRLNLAGEHEYPVGPLPVPAEFSALESLVASPSTQLYIDRARAARFDFEVTAQNAEILRNICERLDGIPLALELAAALSSTMTLPEVLAGLRTRFDLLVSRRRDISDRHRSLRAAVEYGFDKLSPELQRVFSQLSVFQDGWTADAAAFVCELNDPNETLRLLAERSLIRVSADPDSTVTRYSMFETLREYGWELLPPGERETTRRRLAEHYGGLRKTSEGFTGGMRGADWLNLIEAERRNMVYALGWCCEAGDVELGLRIAVALEFHWEARGPSSEGREWLARLLALVDGQVSPESHAEALWAQGRLAWIQGDYREAGAAHEESLAIYERLGDRGGIAKSYYNLGIVDYRLGNYERAHERIDRSLVVAREIGDRAGIAYALLNLSNIAVEAGQLGVAKNYLNESYELEKSIGNHIRAASLLNNFGYLASSEKKHILARRYFEESVAELRRYGNNPFLGIVLSNLAVSLGKLGSVDRAVRHSIESIQICWSSGSRYDLRWGCLALGLLAAWTQEAETAATLFGVADRLTAEMQLPSGEEDEVNAEQMCRSILGDEAFEAARDFGTSMTDERAVEYALQRAETMLQGDLKTS